MTELQETWQLIDEKQFESIQQHHQVNGFRYYDATEEDYTQRIDATLADLEGLLSQVPEASAHIGSLRALGNELKAEIASHALPELRLAAAIDYLEENTADLFAEAESL